MDVQAGQKDKHHAETLWKIACSHQSARWFQRRNGNPSGHPNQFSKNSGTAQAEYTRMHD